MNHKKAEKILSVFYDFELSEKEHLEVAEHAEVCKSCQFTLKQLEGISAVFSRSAALQPSESFTNRFIDHLAHLEISVKKVGQRFSFLNDLFFPLAGYSFALLLMITAVMHWEPYMASGKTITESMLLTNIPQETQWSFSQEKPEMTNLLATKEEA